MSESAEPLASNEGRNSVPQVVVAQIGSRRNYAIPIALEEAGALVRLFTDWYAPASAATRLVASFARWFPHRCLVRAATRESPEIPVVKVTHFPDFAIRYKWAKFLAARWGTSPLAYIWGGEKFCRTLVRAGIPTCDAIYCFSSAAKEIFEVTHDRPILRILDQGIPPLAYDDRLVREQETAYREWAKPRPAVTGVEEYAERQRQEWALADLILCPSTFCRNALIAEGGPLRKTCILPSGVHPRFFLACSRPENGKLRVLFAANTPIRKGLPDLVLALERLFSRNVEAVFAGEISTLTQYAVTRAAKVGRLLGNVPRNKMVDLYRWASVLVLPTVSDIFPGVILEAMAAGLPVITTGNCGASDVIREGIDGFVVPVRSPDAIAEKLDFLATHPNICREMGCNAAERAQEFTLSRYRERLIDAIQGALVQLKR